jgi:hypothetical protein
MNKKNKRNINKKHKCRGPWAKTKDLLALQIYERQKFPKENKERVVFIGILF